MMVNQENAEYLAIFIPYRRRIDIDKSEIYIDKKPLEGKRKKAAKILLKRFNTPSFGISRTALYKRLRKEKKTLLKKRLEEIKKFSEDKKLLEAIYTLRKGGKFKRFLKDLIEALEAKKISITEKIADLGKKIGNKIFSKLSFFSRLFRG